MARVISLLVSLGLLSSSTFYAAQNKPSRPPVIDVHTHIAPQKGPAIMDALNVRYWLAGGDLPAWARLDKLANRYMPTLSFPCPGGRDVIFGKVTCYDTGAEWPDISWLRGEMQSGRIKALGEVLPEYMGIAPGDPVMEPYWRWPRSSTSRSGFTWGPGRRGRPTSRAPRR